MSDCIFCPSPLTSINAHVEHIIPNALGGKLKSRQLDCAKCNSDFGERCDAQIAKNLNPLANLLHIERERGDVQPMDVTVGGKSIRRLSSGELRPNEAEHSIETTPSGVQVSAKARDPKQLRQLLGRIARDYPKLDVEKAMTLVQAKKEYPREWMNVSFSAGGDDTFRAIAKMALLFFKLRLRQHKISAEADLIAYIKCEREYKQTFFYYPPTEIADRAPGQILHSIIIKSYPAERLLLAFVDLFSVVSVVLVLADDFTEDVAAHYVFDVLARQEVQSPTLRFPVLDRASLEKHFNELPSPGPQIEDRLKLFLPVALSRQIQHHVNDLVGEVVTKYCARFAPGTDMTPEMNAQLSSEIMAAVGPFLASRGR